MILTTKDMLKLMFTRKLVCLKSIFDNHEHLKFYKESENKINDHLNILKIVKNINMFKILNQDLIKQEQNKIETNEIILINIDEDKLPEMAKLDKGTINFLDQTNIYFTGRNRSETT